jgi:hypothetical protein
MQIYIKDIEHFSRLRSVSRNAYPIRPRLINLSSLPMHKGDKCLIFLIYCVCTPNPVTERKEDE